MSSVKLSVVIATFNRRHVLERTLPTLLAQDLPSESYELIFVVDGSTDGTSEMLRRLEPKCALHVLEQSHRGPSAARNKGIHAARGDLVLFLDDDILCPSNLLRQHCATHPSLDPLIVHGPIYVAPDSPTTLIKYRTEVWYERYYRSLEETDGLQLSQGTISVIDSSISREIHRYSIGSYLSVFSSIINSSIPLRLLHACGGFDERAPSKEDLDLGLRLWNMGVHFRHNPQAAAYELFMKSSQEFLQKQVEGDAKAEVYLSRKHPEYRPLSRVSGLAETHGGKRLLRNIVMQSPLSPASLLSLPIWAAEQLCRFIPIRKTGVRLLGAAERIIMLRAVLRETSSWKALQREFGIQMPVLMYHHVGPSRPNTYPALTVSSERFERQIRWLARRGYTGIRPADWVEWLRHGKNLPDKPILLTFDDGYADLADYALPVLRRYGFGAVVFVVTGLVGGTNAWDEARGSGTHRLMTAEQIRYWATQGIEFGAHSRTHADLTTLSANELEKEIVGSRDELAKISGCPVTSFAYPYASYNQMVYECAQGAYDLTFRGDEKTPGINFLCTDPHDQQRTMVQPGDWLADLECRVRWGHSPLMELRSRLRVRTRFKRAWRFILGRRKP
jgi:peptidoglycan/xylan/chitin deacetylase (PgdA/CDA1 family)/glycosyltransferase involved in cell wall biosynthesis